jgi:bifunctional oligoribonuclease and PAP phosphatase NrnA
MGPTSETEEAGRLISSSGSVLVIGHQFPDGDAIGSVLAMSLMLTKAGHEVCATWPDPFDIPEKYSSLPGAELLCGPGEVMEKPDLSIALDCANARRLEELAEKAVAGPLINVDHHPDNTRFGTVNIVDPVASATSQIVFSTAAHWGLEVDRDAAVCLYTGIVTDTGRFQFSNTTGETLRVAGALIELGVKPHQVFQEVYQSDSLAYLRLSGEILCRAVYDEELGLIYGFLSQNDLAAFGVKMNETEDLIDNLRALRGHRVAVLFKEQESGNIRVSLRSRLDIDIGSVARRLGGGGHRVAAGYTSETRTIEDALAELKGEMIAAGWGPVSE